MKKREKGASELASELFMRYPALESCRIAFYEAYGILLECYKNGGKVLVGGNGGSAADSEHIVGELMKSFLFFRRVDLMFEENMRHLYASEGEALCGRLEGALPAIPIVSLVSLSSAFANDVDSAAAFAQAVYGLGAPKDVFWGISTSGNARNIRYALMTAKAIGLRTILLTGGTGGECRSLADVAVCVPENETFKIQEYHLPVYHALCAMLEADLFDERR